MKKSRTKVWTVDDYIILKELYPKESNKLISILLHRTEVSIRKKAQKLGLKKTKERLQQSRLENLNSIKKVMK